MTREQVNRLAPDPATLERAVGLTDLRKWKLVQSNETVAWGECIGSGETPYKSMAFLAGDVWRCSCPVKRMPCKHSLALLLLTADDAPVKFAASEPPPWVQDWLDAAGRTKSGPASPTDVARRGDGIEKNLEARMGAMEAGVADLQIRLSDIIRQGLAHVSEGPTDFWQESASRLVDAKLGGLARSIKSIGSTPMQNEDRYERMLETISGLYLFTLAFKNKNQLSPELKEDLWSMAGVTLKKEDLTALTTGTTDCWLALGQRTAQEEDNLSSRRVWLAGLQTGKIAVILDFAYGKADFSTIWENGRLYQGEMIFYPGAYPLRAFPAPAFIKEESGFARYGLRTGASFHIPASTTESLPWRTSFQEMAQAYAFALSRNPWLIHFPVLIYATLLFTDRKWFLLDKENKVLPVQTPKRFFRSPLARGESEEDGLWALLSLSGGRPAQVFGEWNGKSWDMIGAIAGERALFF